MSDAGSSSRRSQDQTPCLHALWFIQEPLYAASGSYPVRALNTRSASRRLLEVAQRYEISQSFQTLYAELVTRAHPVSLCHHRVARQNDVYLLRKPARHIVRPDRRHDASLPETSSG